MSTMHQLNSKTFILKSIFFFMALNIEIIHGIEHEVFNKSPLHCAADQGNTEIVKLLLNQEGIDINSIDTSCIGIINDFRYWILAFNVTPLIYAASSGHTEVVKLLLNQEGIDINYKDDTGI